MKLSILTATYNRVETVQHAIDSLQSQTHQDYEHIVQDGGSTDGTLERIKQSSDQRTHLVSERDDGIYDALNRALARATGEAVGLLHSDDFLASPTVLEVVARAFEDTRVDAVYGDLHYVSKTDTSRIVRNWRSGQFTRKSLKQGWMPPHPALFVRRACMDPTRAYDTSYSISADYDFILRCFSRPNFTAVYVPEVFVKMRVGGESNRSLGRILKKSSEDYRALRANCVGGLRVLLRKNLRKVGQFVRTDSTSA